ncbi:MAG TPA: glutamate--cysteine ligase, partial [Intrasporangium sp.]|nr:glutamate--cysteine ligase [Intrasporangium sp.]
VLANAAFYYGTMRVLDSEDRPVWTRMSFSAAEANFEEGARLGIDARTYWPGLGEVPATELVLRRLLPMAHEGLERWGVSQAVRDRYLSVIEQRCLTNMNGACWQAECVARLESRGLTRDEALREMLAKYMEGMNANEPVHTWELPKEA